MRDKRSVDELSIEELEIILAIKKREARQARLRSLAQRGRVIGTSPEDDRQPIPVPQLHEMVADIPAPAQPETFDTTAEMPRWEDTADDTGEAEEALKVAPAWAARRAAPPRETVQPLAVRRRATEQRVRRDRLLLGVEVAALIAFLALVVGTLLYMLGAIDKTNQELASIALPTPTITPEIGLDIVLPSGHTPPDALGGAQPNLQEIPEHLRPMVQARLDAPVTVPTPGEGSPMRVRIAAIGVDHPVVMGDDWEALKRGVGYHLGSANPGMRGNMVLSAHNDIYGEIFRHLDQLSAGDEVVVYTMTQEYHYVVRESRVVEKSDTWVLGATQSPTLTLISCYPYMIDTQRIVVFADLVE